MIIYDLMMMAYVYEMDINSYLHFNNMKDIISINAMTNDM